jgi:hypothetical protein
MPPTKPTPVFRQVSGDSAYGYKSIPSEPEPDENLESERNHEIVMRIARKAELAASTAYSLHPHGSFFKVWNPTMLLLIVADSFLQPVTCAFAYEHWKKSVASLVSALSLVIWVMYVVDTLLQFMTQMHKENGCGMETSLRNIAVMYVGSLQFRLDIVTIVPWVFLYEMFQPRQTVPGDVWSGTYIMVFCLTRLFRAVRLSAIGRLLSIWQHKIHLPHAARTVAECSFALLILVHYLACIWCMVGILNPMGKETWLDWLPRDDLQSDGAELRIYAAAVYWALATTTGVGYGDVTPAPGNDIELIACIAGVIVAAIAWTIMIANVVQLVNNIHEATEEYQKMLDTCERLFESEAGIDTVMKHQIREYVSKYFEVQHTKDSQGVTNVLSLMSPMLQRETVKIVFDTWITKVPWIRKMSHSCLVELVFKMKQLIYIPHEFIPDLRLTSFVEQGTAMISGHILHKGDCWGMDMTLDGPLRKHETGHALTFLLTLGLWKHGLEEVLQE